MNRVLEKLAAAGIQVIPSESESHFVMERDGFVAFVERHENGFGNIGAPVLMTERGFAALVWREGKPLFVGKGFELIAEEKQVEQLRAFTADLGSALSNPEY